MTLAGFGPHTRRIGLFTAENDNFYCQYLCLTRPAMDARAQNEPHLHLYRCSAYTPELRDLIRRQAFGTDHRRDQPHWARMGPSREKWDGWVWSQGDGWFWTARRGWFELIPRMGRGSASASTPQSRAGYSA